MPKRFTITGEGPTGVVDVLVQALRTLNSPELNDGAKAALIIAALRQGPVTFQISTQEYSTEFVALGMTSTANEAVVRELLINTVAQLCQRSEEDLLEVTDFGHGNLLSVNRALADRGLQLAGDPIPVDDRLERLQFSTSTIRLYRALKHHGFNRISQLRALDIVSLQEILGRHFRHLPDLLHLLDLADLHPAPLGPTRQLRDLIALRHTTISGSLLTLGAELFPGHMLVHEINAANLKASLALMPNMGPENLDHWFTQLRHELEQVGYELPEGPGAGR